MSQSSFLWLKVVLKTSFFFLQMTKPIITAGSHICNIRKVIYLLESSIQDDSLCNAMGTNGLQLQAINGDIHLFKINEKVSFTIRKDRSHHHFRCLADT